MDAVIDVFVDADAVFDVDVLMLMLMLMLERKRRREEEGGRRRDGECTQKPEPQSSDMGKKVPATAFKQNIQTK